MINFLFAFLLIFSSTQVKDFKKYNEIFQKKGIKIYWSPFCGKYKGKKYPDSYTEKEIKILGLTRKDLKRFHQKRGICNVGYNVGVVNPHGIINYCFKIHKSIGNVYERIKFNKGLINCPFKYYICPLHHFDTYLFKKAIIETNLKIKNPFLFQIQGIKELLIKFIKNELKTQHYIDNFIGDFPTFIEPVHLSSKIKIGDDVLIGPNVYIGNNCEIGDYGEIINTILFDNVMLGENFKLENCVVARGSKLNFKNFKAFNCVLKGITDSKNDLKIISF